MIAGTHRRICKLCVLAGAVVLLCVAVYIFTSGPAGEDASTPVLECRQGVERPIRDVRQPTGVHAFSETQDSDFVNIEGIRDDVLDDLTSNKLSVRLRHWVEDERRAVTLIKKEGFADSIAMMADWDTSYLKLVLPGEARPALPESLKRILYSRRFAKLLEDTRDGVSKEQRLLLKNNLRKDLAHFRQLVQDGQDLSSPVRLFKKVGTKSEDLLVPLSYRINAQVLLIGQRSVDECLPEIVDVAQVMGEHTNWSAVAYACGKILDQMNTGLAPSEQQGILAEYAAWKAVPENSALLTRPSQMVPSFMSTQRPFERATSMGAPLDRSEGEIRIELPPMYEVFVTSSPGESGKYIDISGKSAAARVIVGFAEKVAAGMAGP